MINERDKLNNDKEKIMKEKIAEQLTEQLTNKINELQKSIDNLKNKEIITTHNITNNIQNNLIVNINSFGKETLDHITLQDYKKYFNSFFKGFISFIEKVHFDDNVPENHNICITNLKSKDIKVYEGDKWVAKPKTDIIDKFLRKKLNTLIDKCEELEDTEQISDKVVDKFSEFQINYMDDSAKKNTKNDVILMMYNNKDKIKVK
jgi:hypothetical protein